MERIPLSRPSISPLEKLRVASVLESGRLALGPEILEFEDRMSIAAGTDYAVATNSGTSALHIILVALGIDQKDEIITTPFSFVASSNAALFCGARPIFVDIDANTLNIDPGAIEAAINDSTRGIIGVDVFGVPADWTTIENIAERHGLVVVDDACEALGATIDGRKIGSFGDAASFGYYPNKQITTGEGGCVTTNSGELAEVMRSLRNQGRSNSAVMNHVRLGYNYRMNELSAALGNAQLERLDELLNKRRAKAQYYSELLAPYADEISTPSLSTDYKRSWFVYVIQLAPDYSGTERDQVMQGLRNKGIECAPYFPCIHLQPYYVEQFGYRRGMFPVAESISDRSIALPFYPEISSQDQERVVQGLLAEVSTLHARTTVRDVAFGSQKQM
ncbi:MAG: DegT/DnrJ/EryC1/StrS family aminotransferase [Rhodothermales bacterium]|nr:DegT/DnrJ/EryC1/StrS family aminotransferase [Rhodothermales bacterium]